MLTLSAPLHRQLRPELQKIEVWSTMAIPSFRVVGLPGQEIIESCERVRAAIEASGMEFPRKRVLVNLSPAGVRKQGTGTDLAIALAVMAASAGPDRGSPHRHIVASGELALDGSVRSAGRVLRACAAAHEAGATDLVLAAEDELRASHALQLLEGTTLRVHLVRTLSELIPLILGEEQHSPLAAHALPEESREFDDLMPLDRELEQTLGIAAAGSHHLILLGPKGTGKTASLRWLHALQSRMEKPDLLDRLLLEELVDPQAPIVRRRAPVRVVSPQVRPETLLGGMSRGELRPGELSQAHGGTLLADEFLEWPRDSRECLRDPMESGIVHLTRSQLHVELPARFQLAASANLCRCGGWPRAWSASHHRTNAGAVALCQCPDHSRRDYLARLSGPILDRIDLVHLVIQSPRRGPGSGQSTGTEGLVESVHRCRQHLVRRWGAPPGRLQGALVEAILREEPRLEAEWKSISRAREPSLRRRHKEIRVALSLAAWECRNSREYRLPEKIHFRQAIELSADSWWHGLDRTEIRGLRRNEGPQESRIDPQTGAV